MMRITTVFCSLMCLAIAAPAVLAQNTCSVNGLVQDQTGAVLPRMPVELIQSDGHVTQTTQTGATGNFSFPNIACGKYTVRTYVPGFTVASQELTALPLSASSATLTLSLPRPVEVLASSEGEVVPFAVDPTWNAWEESTAPDDKPSFAPERALKPKTDYTLTIDLSALSYGELPGLFSQKASADAIGLLQKARGKTRLDVVVIPDSLSFDPQTDAERHGYIDVDVGKIRATTAKSVKLKKAPFDLLRKKADPDFEFGRFRVHIKTSSKVGQAGIAISIWKNGTPIDEFSVPVCVTTDSAQACPNAQVNSFSLKGNVVGALAANIPTPDASLQFVQQDSSHLVGVFRCNNCAAPADQGFKTWEMGESVDGLIQYLSQTIVEELNKAVELEPATPDADYLKSGESLYLELFRDRTSGATVPEAYSFNRFVGNADLSAKPGGTTLFVRFLPAKPEPLLLLPVGLMVIPGSGIPLAARVRITVPLENQVYSQPTGCIDQWKLLVPDPTQDDSMSSEVNDKFKAWNVSFQNWKDHATVYDGDANIDAFQTWISALTPTDTPTAVLLISHQKDNKVFFNEQSETPWIDSNHILREFSKPSLAILGACGTAGPGQAEFVRQFNLRGMATVIGTPYELDARMAGVFVSSLMRELDRNRHDQAYTISNAVSDAMKDVSTTPLGDGPRLYGPRAFAFILAGNNQLRVCVPTPSPTASKSPSAPPN